MFAIWREETAPAVTPVDIVELKKKLASAEAAAAENLARAQRAELREEAHQDKWALEVDRLRQEIQARKADAAMLRGLQERALELSRELMAARMGR